MKKTISQLFWLTSMALVSVAMLSPSLSARSFKSYSFPGHTNDGYAPAGGLTYDGVGSFYGVTSEGGPVTSSCTNGCGTVFKFSKDKNGVWGESVIYDFTAGKDGGVPHGNLVMDSNGNLYGAFTSNSGGVFELLPNGDGTWLEKVLYAFTGNEYGGYPLGSFVFDMQGNLYGSGWLGGCNGSYCYGSIFELSPSSNGTWTESLIYSFQGGDDGEYPSPVTFGPDGNLYGTTAYGGTGEVCQGCGTVFELAVNSGIWTHIILHNFTDELDGAQPSSGVLFDNFGNFYGEAQQGGSFACPLQGCGVVFEMAPAGGGGWSFSVAHTFNGAGGTLGWAPYGGLTMDALGNLFGTTAEGGSTPNCVPGGFGCGTIFKLSPTSSGHLKLTLVASFHDVNGAFPLYGVTLDAAGNIYGTTEEGGKHQGMPCDTYGCGTAFMLTP